MFIPLKAQSVLQTGKWFKIGVLGTGVYKLDYATLTQLDPVFKTADPRQFRIYGNGGAPLPQANSAPRATDLTENAIQITGESDGRLDAADALYFYAAGPKTVYFDKAEKRLRHQLNPYADTAFYFLTITDGPGKRITTRAAGAPPNNRVITTYDHYDFYERDTTTLTNSGRQWWGDYFGTYPQQIFPFMVPGRVLGAPSIVALTMVGVAPRSSSVSLSLNSADLGTAKFDSVSAYEFAPRGSYRQLVSRSVLPTATDELRFTITFNRDGNGGGAAYMDYFSIQTPREIRQYDRPATVRGGAGQYIAKQATIDLLIWNITNVTQPVQQAYTLTNGQATWSAPDSSAFLLHTLAMAGAPVSVKALPNQNIRAATTPNLLIITPDAWRDQAERLAGFRRRNDNLTVLVVTTAQVYNEFSSGQTDPTALRDACRYFDKKQPGTLRYLLLMGDASFDYRNKTLSVTPAQLPNLIPTYESRESLDPVRSFTSDDYFGFLQDDAGEWVENASGNHPLDIGVGRLAVKTPAEARNVVDKLIRYTSDTRLLGDWRTRLMLVADDGDGNIHQEQADQLASLVERHHPELRPQRLFLDTFKQDTIQLPGQPANYITERAPLVNQTVNRAVDEGRLIINYAGHGGTTGWAQEQILTVGDILSWKNTRLPLFVTATCQFGRYDDPSVVSGAELAQLDRGGAIGLLTTARPVYANTNFMLNTAFYGAIFKAVEGKILRLGDVMRDTKNNSFSDVLNRNFTLLGDPSMAMAAPRLSVAFTQVNGRATPTVRLDTLRADQLAKLKTDTLSGGQRVTLSGEVRTLTTAQLQTGFNGTVRVVVYDKPLNLLTRGTERTNPFPYRAYESVLYAGNALVQQGRFSVAFTVPADVNPAVGFGRVYAYAVRADSTADAVGGYQSLVFGGKSTLPADTRPPSLTLSLVGADPAATRPQVPGPVVNVRVQVADDTGVNLTQTTANHGPTLQLDNNAPVRIADYYSGTADGRGGEFVFPVRDLTPGTYLVRVRVFDLNNNPADATLTFSVSDQPPMSLQNLVSVPNPMREQGQWQFLHNRPGQNLTLTWQLADLKGRILTERQQTCYDCPGTVTVEGWNGIQFPLPTGMYLLRLRATINETAEQATATSRVLKVD
ncbi:type IX secretion system sortase PorU [Fibrella aquatilis]|uniref:Type IX secretion system sortase PorU n=1 Tax=Fibrella aquatilis TaxID=2817059 RepID=A0A939JXX9_9BACT|nr:type IX secretion system sortase PorU [Fibrella aquatilis]MBO0933442.1 type IX secretion system sortase PorU [Fibrella aquatilis]